MLQSMGLQRIGHGLATEQQPHWLLLRRTLTSTPEDNKTQWCHSYWLASNGTEQGGKQERVEPDGKWSFNEFFVARAPSVTFWIPVIQVIFLSSVLDLIFFFFTGYQREQIQKGKYILQGIPSKSFLLACSCSAMLCSFPLHSKVKPQVSIYIPSSLDFLPI